MGAHICPQKVGFDVLSFVQILLGKNHINEKNFLNDIAEIPEVLECHNTTGEWSYLVEPEEP